MKTGSCGSLVLGLGSGLGSLMVLSGCTAMAPMSGDCPPFEVRVEVEETAFSCPEYKTTNNGSGMFWGSGSSQIVRLDDRVFISAFEHVPGCAPLNNARWALHERDTGGWHLRQRDEKGRTREPCPLAVSHSGRLLMSANPTLAPWIDAKPDPKTGKIPVRGGPAQPEFLEFDPASPERAPKHLIPRWANEQKFSDHSYRAFGADGDNGEFVLFNKVGATHTAWAFLDRHGKWKTGELIWPKGEDPKHSVWRSDVTPVNYANVVLSNRQVYCIGQSPYNIWNRIDPANTETWGRGKWGWRMRKLHYAWTPDIATTPFREWSVVDDTMDDGGTIGMGDSWLAPDGRLHVVYQKHPINPKLRDQYFPDIKRDYRLCYAILKDGQVLQKRVLLAGGETTGPLEPHGYIGHPRFHITPDHSMYILCKIRGTTPETRPQSGTYALRVGADGAVSEPVRIPLERPPRSSFFTASPRAGNRLTETADLLIADTIDGKPVARYARLSFCPPYTPVVTIKGTGFALAGEGRQIELEAEVADPQGDAVSVRWRLPDGSVRDGISLKWLVPPAVGNNFTVIAEATDGDGNTGRGARSLSLPPAELAEASNLVFIEAETLAAQGGGEAKVCHPVNVKDASISYWHMSIGHWLEWDLDVPADGKYELWMRYTTDCSGTRRSLLIDGKSPGPAFANIAVPTTGGWCTDLDQWAYMRLGTALELTAGKHRLRMTNLADGLGVDFFILRPSP